MNDTILCPVCGRGMKIGYGLAWICRHGNTDQDVGLFFGPVSDPDGSKVRAQIAAMEKRILEKHGYAWEDGRTHGETLAEQMGVKDEKCPSCGMSILEDNPNYCLVCRSPHKGKQRGNAPENATPKPTCGQCAWAGTIRTIEFKDGPHEVIFCRRNTFGHTGMVQEGGASIRVELTQGMCYAATPACPAFVGERSEKS